MSVGQYPKDSLTSNQALKVQSLRIRGSDVSLYGFLSGNCQIHVNEPVNAVYLASLKVDSSNTTTLYAQSSISIVDSNGGTSGFNQMGQAVSDRKYIQITGLASLAANDVLSLEYVVLEHL